MKRRFERPPEETKMNVLSITSIKTMSYDADVSVRAFAIVDKLGSVTGALLQAAPAGRRSRIHHRHPFGIVPPNSAG
jgi:hypothetical protein